MTPEIKWNGPISGVCPSQGFGTVTVQGTVYGVYFRSRYGRWSLEITDPNPDRSAPTTVHWFWHGTDDTAWGLVDPSASELCAFLVAKPVGDWPTPDSYKDAVTISLPVVLPSGVCDAASEIKLMEPDL